MAVQADQAQITSAISSIDRIATQTQFGSKKLLDGSSGTSSSVANSSIASSVNIGTSFLSGTTSYTTSSGNITLTSVTKAVRATATATNANYAAGLTDNVTYASTIVINGQTVNATTGDTVQSLLNKINNLTSTTGVTATFDSTAKQFSLQATAYGASAAFNISEVAANGANGALGIGAAGAGGSITNATATTAGVNGSASVSVNTTAGAQTDTFTGGTGADGLVFTDKSGNTLHLTEQGNTLTGSTTPALPQQIGVLSASAVQFQIGANANQTAQLSLGNIQSSQLGTGTAAVNTTSLSKIDVTTATGANDAILVCGRSNRAGLAAPRQPRSFPEKHAEFGDSISGRQFGKPIGLRKPDSRHQRRLGSREPDEEPDHSAGGDDRSGAGQLAAAANPQTAPVRIEG